MKNLLGLIFILFSFTIVNGQWVKKPFPYNTDLTDTEFADKKNGWIIGHQETEGMIFKTTDGGENWIKIFSGSFKPQKLQVIDNSTLFFNDAEGNLYVSKDGGSFWNKHKVAAGNFYYSFVNKTNGWCTSYLNSTFSIKKTIDGGANWITIKEAYQDNYLKDVADIYFYDDNTGWVCGVEFIYKTEDGGSNWDFIDLKGWVDASAISFTNKDLGWITCKWHLSGTPNIIFTNNGGDTWNNCNIEPTEFETGQTGSWFPLSKFSRVESVDSNNIYLPGLSKSGYGQILKAEFSKVHFPLWKNQPTSDTKPWFINTELNDIEIIDADNIVVVGMDGTYLKKDTTKSITLVSPNGNEKIYPKNIVPITWKAQNLITDKIDIYASSNSGSDWNLIAENIQISRGFFNWRVYLPPTSKALIKIVQKSNNLFDLSDNTFSIIDDTRKLKLEYPVYGDTIHKNSDINLKWSSNYQSPGPVKIIFTFKNSGSTSSFDSIFADFSKGSCIWHSPDLMQDIDITIQDAANPEILDFVSNVFVTYPPSIQIVSPGKGYKWQVDSIKQIIVSGLYLRNFSLFLSVDNGNSWESLGSSYYTPDYYSPNKINIKVPNKVSDKCKIKVVANKDPQYYHITDSTFSITNAKNLGYFPLKIGNRWYYKYITSYGFNGVYKMLIITKDSLIDNKRMYQLDEYTSDKQEFVLTKRAFRFYLQEGNSILEFPNIYTSISAYKIFDLSDFSKNINVFNKSFDLYEWSGGFTPSFYYRSFINNIGIKTYGSQGRPYWNDLVQYELVGCDIDGQTYGETFEGYQVGITNEDTGLPTYFFLSQNYPNPFNPETTISYSIPKSEHVTLKIFDVLGREVATLVDEYKNAGTYNVVFNVKTPYMASLPSGIYFYRLQAGSYSQTKKLILMK